MFSLLSNLLQWLFSKNEVHILVLGLDGAGKTTFLEHAKSLLKTRQAPSNLDRIAPTVGLNIARIDIGSTRVILWDLGGQSLLRGIWSKYYADANGLVFIVDSASSAERLDEAKETLRQIASHPDLAHVPFLLCANKQDQTGSLSVAAVDARIDFTARCSSNKPQQQSRRHGVRGVSALTGAGLESAIQWIVDASNEFGPRVNNHGAATTTATNSKDAFSVQ